MTRGEWQHIKEIAAAVLAEPESARPGCLDSWCRSDSTLRAEVESLLTSTLQAADLFETPTLLMRGAGAALDALSELDETARLGERVGAYRLIRALGGGGMGTAYLAARADDAFQKDVAIKLIKRGMDTAAVLRRFRHERQILAGLDHPNIARLLDGGTTADGLPYFVMEYVDGEPLDQYVATRALTIAERLAIFRRICEAVQYAHEHQVIHRDLKPGNILVTSHGAPKLLDFGIATVLTPDRAQVSDEPTLTSRAMTPHYASPEQVRGEVVTVASDVYSLGVLLYELLTGQHPHRFDGRTIQEIDQIICHDVPDRPSTRVSKALVREVAGDLDNIVLTALRKEPQRRYASVAELSEDIRRHLKRLPVQARAEDLRYRAASFVRRHRVRVAEAAFLLVVLAVAAGAVWWPGPGGGGDAVKSLAVLPLTTPGGPDVEYVSDGLTEGLIESLSALPRLSVAARNSVFAFKGKRADPRDIGRQLRVGTVLLGSVSPAGDALVLDVELRDGSDGRRLWGARYETRVSDLAGVRERVARDVAQQLQPSLSGAERQLLGRRATDNSEAYRLYLRGRYVWNKRTEEGFTQGLDYFRQALEQDPRYALAYAGIADCYNLLGVWGALSPHEAMPKVKDAALKAIALDDSLAEAHASLAFVHWVYDWDWMAAGAEFERALELNPGYATAHDWYAYYLASRRRFDEAVRHITRAQELEPVSLSIGTDVGEIYFWAGRYDRAVEQLKNVLQVEPGFAMAHNILGLTYLRMGRAAEGVQELETAERLASGPRTKSTLGYGYGVSGAQRKAGRVLDELRTLSTSRYTSAFSRAVAYAGLRRNDEALEQLELAFNERSDTMAILSVYPLLDNLRDDPRFRDLLQRVGPADGGIR